MSAEIPESPRLSQEQTENGGEESDTDYIFDIPVELAKAVTGFRHDEDPPGGEAEPFRVLVEAQPTPRSWIRKLFGGQKDG